MKDKVQLIKEEIERRIKEGSSKNDISEGALALDSLLDFIDSLPEKPVSEYLDFQTFAEEMHTVFALPSSETQNTEENPLNWEYAIARHFAEWQKQKDEKLFKNDSWNYIEENYPSITQEEKLRLYDISIKSRLAGANTIKQHMKEALQTEYEKGRFDMREEMMKDAVETTIVNDWQYGKDPDHAIIPAIHQRIEGFDVGDKVKIIIIKPEQQ